MDSDEEESYITIGTPLPDIDADDPVPKPVKYQEQSVKDARGRPQRFHGAFTGGFSAGFFNTVATPEGFEPSTFVSSRTKRAEKEDVKQQHPEDFMDDEDLGEHGIAPRKIQTTSKFESQETSANRQLRQIPKEGLLSSAVLANLITPASLPMGVKLLRRMGWKEGQGIGPRQMKRKKARPSKPAGDGKSIHKVYGCAPPPARLSDGESEASSDEDYQGITFAPKDVTPISFKPKDNVHGIGFSGINPNHVFSQGQDQGQSQGQSHFSLFDKRNVPSARGKRKGMRGQAFGVGALNEDDDDIYASDNLSRYTFEINDHEPDSNYGWTAPRTHSGDKKGGTAKLIEGFKVTKQSRFSKKTYPPPTLPKDFRPVHRRKVTPEVAPSSDGKVGKDKERHDASTRSEVLGEAPEFRSVFDLVPEAEKKRMDSMKPNIPQRTNRWDRKESLPGSSEQATKDKGPSKEDKPTSSANQNEDDKKQDQSSTSSQGQDAKSAEEKKKRDVPLFQPATFTAVGGFQPFAKIPEKQQRYEAFLEAKKKGVPYVPNATTALTEWEKVHEVEEFSRAAHLYTRVNSVMAARFTHGNHGDAIDSDTVTKGTEEMEVDKSDQDKAAEMNMYGKLTREVVEWHPHKNLCKYFNIPNPYPESTIVGLKTVKRDKYSLYNFLHIPEEPEPPAPPPKEPQKALTAPDKAEKKKSIFSEDTLAKVNQKITFKIGVDQKEKESDVGSSEQTENNAEGHSGEGLQKDSEQEEEAEEVEKEERPPMDLFRSIFSGSESSSDSESDEEESKSQQETSKSAGEPVNNSKLSDADLRNTAETGTNNSSVVNFMAPPPGTPKIAYVRPKRTEEQTDKPESLTDDNANLDSNSRLSQSNETESPVMQSDQATSDLSYGPSLPPDSYGPAPPPSSEPSQTSVSSREVKSATTESRSRSTSGRSKHKSDKKKHKEKKKSKHRKEKKKKSKHKKSSSKHKEKKKDKESSSSADESDDSDNSREELVDEKDLLARLKGFAR